MFLKNNFGNGTHIPEYMPSSPKPQTKPQVVPVFEETNLKFTQEIFETIDENCFQSEEYSVNMYVHPKGYTFSRNPLFLKFYIPFMIIFCIIFLLSMSQVRFFKQMSSNFLVGAKYYDYVFFYYDNFSRGKLI